MKIPELVLLVVTEEEASLLMRFYGTSFYNVYLEKLKKKYRLIYSFLDEEPDGVA